jgi:hypothetical protein
MKSKQIMFFATNIDLTPVLNCIEMEFDFNYVEMGLFENKQVKIL